jgi:5-methyltetrahydropteroyltriglutamate--homocysteine methyltransferase
MKTPLADICGVEADHAGAILLSMANPPCASVPLEQQPLPADTTLVAGVIDTTTNQHETPTRSLTARPDAESLDDLRCLMAGTDCGFETSAGFSAVIDDIVWQKLAAMVEGRARAVAVIWRRLSRLRGRPGG